MKRLTLIFLVWTGLMFICPAASMCGDKPPVLVFAAASTTNAITDIAAMFEKDTGVSVRTSFASSSTLARQIDSGAPADLYISANVKWMTFLEEKDRIAKDSRVDLLGNKLVMIAPAGSSVTTVSISPDLDLPALLDGGRLSMGDPGHVPAGMYAKSALSSLGLWTKVETALAPAKDVRAALALVARNECPMGVVYATDAAISREVKTVGVFPASSHPAIVYPFAAIAGRSNPSADAFFRFLRSDAAARVFETYGFTVNP